MARYASHGGSGRYRSWLVCAAVGFGTFLTPQAVLILQSSAPLADSPGWFLNAGRNVRVIEMTLALSAAVVAFFQGRRSFEGAVMFAVGAIWAMALTLFTIGPGTIFPIVIAIGSALIMAAVAVGAAAGLAGRLTLGLIRSTAKRTG